jgi:hypothetical protein
VFGVDSNRGDKIACRIEMDRLRLDSDPHAVDSRRVAAIEPERSDRVALLQLVEAGRLLGPLTKSFGDENELAIQGDI